MAYKENGKRVVTACSNREFYGKIARQLGLEEQTEHAGDGSITRGGKSVRIHPLFG